MTKENIDLAAIAAVKVPSQLVRVFRKHRDFLSHKGQEAERMFSSWEHTNDGTALSMMALRDTDVRLQPLLQLRRPRGPEFQLFKASCVQDHAYFDFPLPTNRNLWVCAAVDRESFKFMNAMFVGSFVDALAQWVKSSLDDLQTSYAEYVNSLDSAQLVRLRRALQNTMLDEVEAADIQHRAFVASIKGRYRNQLNYFATLLDQAQAKKDEKEKATYTFVLTGYPESKPYTTYKEVRRSHSKRNVPNVDCVIYRRIAKHPQTMFARWSVEDRVWVIL